MRRVTVFTMVILVLLIAGVSCGGDEEEAVATPSPAAEPEAEPTPSPEATPPPSPEPTGIPTPRPLSLGDAAQYFDVTAVLPPDFRQADPAAAYLQPRHEFGPGFSEWVVYISEEPYQEVAMLMSLASGETEKAAARRELEDTELLDELFIAPMREEWDLVGVGWEDVDVGDMATYASCLLTKFFPDETRVIDILVFMQEEGPQAAVVQVTSTWLAGETPVVDTITIAEEISNNIANR